jgi:ribonuclease HI
MTPTPGTPGSELTRFRFSDEHATEWTDMVLEKAGLAFTDELLSSEAISEPQLDHTIGALHDAMIEASIKHMRAPKFKPGASPWFTIEVQAALNLSRAAYRALRKARTGSPIAVEESELRFRTARRKLKRIVTKAKRDWALHFSGNIKTSEIWSLNSWYKGIRKYTIPHLETPDGSKAVSPQDKCTLFHSAFFPPPPHVHVDEFNPEIPNADTRPFQDITLQEVKKAIKNVSNTSAPGLSGVGYRPLKWLWHAKPEWVMFIMKWSARLGVHNSRWKRSVVVVLPKPGKPRYDIPKSYRPIQLLECLGKLLEKVIAKRITFDCGKYEILPPEQFGGRSVSSCIDAGLTLTHDIEHAWKRGLDASVLTIDIKGFFDNVNHQRLVRVLWDAGFPLPIIHWVRSFLTDRQAAIKVDDFTGDIKPVDLGIPQGSPVSPVLSVIYSADVIRHIRDSPDLVTEAGYPLRPLSYVDDFAILSISNSLADNAQTLGRGLEQTLSRLRDVGMTIDTDKLDLMHFTRKTKPVLPPIPFSVDGRKGAITPKKVMRWLGIYFDPRLTFREHIKIMCNRSRSIINGVRCLTNTVRGMSQAHLRLLYKTCVVPVMTYASPVWFRTDRPQKSLIKTLDTTQNWALRMISGGFRTTPIPSLQALSHVPPIELTLRRLNDGAAARLSKLPFTHLVSSRLPDEWRLGNPPDNPPPFPPLRHLPHAQKPQLSVIEHLSKRSSPRAERLFPYSDFCCPSYVNPLINHPAFLHMPDPPEDEEGKKARVLELNKLLLDSRQDPSKLIFYCDGSRMKHNEKERSGYGVVCYREGKIIKSFSMGAGRHSTVFDAEMFALAHAAKKAKDIHAMGGVSAIHFFSDSSSTASMIADPTVHPAQLASIIFIRHISQILEANPPPLVTLEWTPGHAGVLGNEEADKAAKAGVAKPSILYTTISYIKQRANESINKAWRKKVKGLVKTEGTKFLEVFPVTRIPTAFFRSTPREIFGRVTQTLTGHGYTGEYYKR